MQCQTCRQESSGRKWTAIDGLRACHRECGCGVVCCFSLKSKITYSDANVANSTEIVLLVLILVQTLVLILVQLTFFLEFGV